MISQESQPSGEIGIALQTQRERLGFSTANVESQIFIPERYLKAIEAGSLEKLPSTVQGRGMVKNYAQFLGLDPEPILLHYADVLQERLKVLALILVLKFNHRSRQASGAFWPAPQFFGLV